MGWLPDHIWEAQKKKKSQGGGKGWSGGKGGGSDIMQVLQQLLKSGGGGGGGGGGWKGNNQNGRFKWISEKDTSGGELGQHTGKIARVGMKYGFIECDEFKAQGHKNVFVIGDELRAYKAGH